MSINWDEVKQSYKQLTATLAGDTLQSAERGALQKKVGLLAEIIAAHDALVACQQSKAALVEEQSTVTDPELAQLYHDELASLQETHAQHEERLQELLSPVDESDARNVFLEIRAGAGGQEAALFVADLFKMYSAYALAKGWQISVVSMHQTDIGGYKEIIAHVKGRHVYKYLKFESGVHRVQRVPQTETQGRVHTSTVTVAVMPEAEDVDITVNPQDLRIDVYRSGGPGGQSVNTTDSAVRITHIPTGIVVQCQDERSQIKNKAKAMKVLQSRLLQAEKARHESEQSAKRKEQVGMGMRSEKIRTYNFPQNRVTDHRINLTLKKLDLVMQGDLDELVNGLQAWDRLHRQEDHAFLESLIS